MGVLALFFYYFSGHSIFERYPVISNIIIMMAGLTAILSATAYNLRVKAFVYYLKLMTTDLPSKQVAENACKTGYIFNTSYSFKPFNNNSFIFICRKSAT